MQQGQWRPRDCMPPQQPTWALHIVYVLRWGDGELGDGPAFAASHAKLTSASSRERRSCWKFLLRKSRGETAKRRWDDANLAFMTRD